MFVCSKQSEEIVMSDLIKKDEYYDDFSKIIEMIETRKIMLIEK